MRLVGAGAVLLALSTSLVSSRLRAQVFELSGGSSTAYDAKGAALEIHGDHSATTLGAGWQAGHFEAGGASMRQFGQRSLTVGQQQMRMDQPTDIFDEAHLFSGMGVGFRTAVEGKDGIALFAGFSADQSGSPLYNSQVLRTHAGVVRWQHAFGESCFVVSTGVISQTSSVLQSLACTASTHWHIAATAGIGAGAPYLAGSTRYDGRRFTLRAAYIFSAAAFSRSTDPQEPVPEPVGMNVGAGYQWTRDLHVNALHQSFRTQAAFGNGVALTGFSNASPAGLVQQATKPPEESEVNDASISYLGPSIVLSASVLESTVHQASSVNSAAYSGRSMGAAFGLERSWSRFRLSETLIESRSNEEAWSSILINSLSVRFNAHVQLEESLNVNGGHFNVTEGGELATRFGTARVDYEMFYVPTAPQRPFQQAMVFTAQVHLFHRLSAEAESAVDPLGRTVYTFRLGTQYARNGAAGAVAIKTMGSGLGSYELRGRVIEAPGTPVEGAAIEIGKQRVYTDSDGKFSLRENRAHSHPLQVLTDEFLTAIPYEVVRAPAMVVSLRGESEEIQIVVARRVLAKVQTLVSAVSPGGPHP